MMQPARIAIKMFIVMLVLLGLIYPLFITLVSQVTMPKEAGGSLIKQRDKWVGSELIGQNFRGENYFWPRPSAVDYDPIKPAGGSNLGPTSAKLQEAVGRRIEKSSPHLPADLAYASASGLDPHITLEGAYYQVDRVAKNRFLTEDQLRSLIMSLSEGVEHKYVNVLRLNIALDQQFTPESHE